MGHNPTRTHIGDQNTWSSINTDLSPKNYKHPAEVYSRNLQPESNITPSPTITDEHSEGAGVGAGGGNTINFQQICTQTVEVIPIS